MPEQGFRRFVLRRMAKPLLLPVLGGSLIVAVALGIHLGESAVSLINPIYYQGAAVHPRDRGAALEEGRLPPPHRRVYADLYGWEEGQAARAAECGDCAPPRPRDTYAYSAEVPYFGPRENLRARVEQGRDELADSLAEPPEPVTIHKGPIERYAHYPVSPEEASDGAGRAEIGAEPKDQPSE